MSKKKEKFYAYCLDNGKLQGITNSWDECKSLVENKRDAKYKSFYTKEEAKDWLENGADYSYKMAKIFEKGIYFDSGTGRGIGTEVRITDENSKNLFPSIIEISKLNKYGNYLVKGSNNYGELTGCYGALKIALKSGIKTIFGDSKVVIDYWSKGFYKEKELKENTIKLIKKVVELRKDFEKNGGKILYISGDCNPADLGFHR